MKYPSRSEYYSAIRNPQFAFRYKDPRSGNERDLDSSLVKGKAVQRRKGHGLTDIWSASGSFAIAFKYETSFPAKTWAIRCFYRSNFDVIAHYRQVLKQLKHSSVQDYFVDFTLLEQGIRVQGACYPVLKMEWIEGKNLKKFIKANLGRKNTLKSLAESWLNLSHRLLEAKIAHGDLQHGNVIVIDRFNQLNLKLIDYDSLYFANNFSTVTDNIKGLSDYQHPLRQSLENRCLEIDFFPQLVIYLSILALAEDKKLWNAYGVDDREGLLFAKKDFEHPHQAAIFQSLAALPDPIPTLAHKLQQICQLQDFKQIPSLDRAINSEIALGIGQQIKSAGRSPINFAQFFAPVVFIWTESYALLQAGFRQLGKIKLPRWQLEPGFYKELSDLPEITEEHENIPSHVVLPETEKTPSFFSPWLDIAHVWWQEKIIAPLSTIELNSIIQRIIGTGEQGRNTFITFAKNIPINLPSYLPIKAAILPKNSQQTVKWRPHTPKANQTQDNLDRPKINKLQKLSVAIQTTIKNQANLCLRQLRNTRRNLLVTRLRTQRNLAQAFSFLGNSIKSSYRKVTNQLSQTSTSLKNQIQNTLVATKNSLKAYTTPKTWTTKEVALQLARSTSWCHRQRYQNPQEFTSGIHYYKDDREIIQWTRAGIKQLQKLLQSKSKSKSKSQPKISIDCVPTKVVSANLGVSSQWITRTKANYSSLFVEGIHYHLNSHKHYVWTPEGIEQLQQIFALIYPQKSSRSQTKIMARK